MAVTVTTDRHLTHERLGVPVPPVPLTPYQYAFDNFIFGHGTRYIVESFKGLLGWEGSSSSTRNEMNHGSTPGLMTMNPKDMELRIRVDAQQGEDVEEIISTLIEAFRPPLRSMNPWVGDFHSRGYFTDSINLRFMRPGWTEPRYRFARVKKTNIESSYDTSTGNVTFDVQFQAEDPLAYGYDINVIILEPGDSIVWEQAGDFPDGYSPYIILEGNLVNPRIRRNFKNFYTPTGGRNLDLAFDLSTTDGMKIDMRNRMIDPMGASLALTDQRFWAIQPSPNDYHFEQTLTFFNGAPDATCQIRTREVWL